MNDDIQDSRALPTIFGSLLFVSLLLFFLFMKVFGLAEVLWLRSFNIVILLTILYSVIRAYQLKEGKNFYDNFGDYIWIGMRTSLMGVSLFALFMAIYLDKLDPAFMDMLRDQESFGGEITPVSAAMIILIEGLSSSIICTFILVQILKSKTIETPLSKTTEKPN